MEPLLASPVHVRIAALDVDGVDGVTKEVGRVGQHVVYRRALAPAGDAPGREVIRPVDLDGVPRSRHEKQRAPSGGALQQPHAAGRGQHRAPGVVALPVGDVGIHAPEGDVLDAPGRQVQGSIDRRFELRAVARPVRQHLQPALPRQPHHRHAVARAQEVEVGAELAQDDVATALLRHQVVDEDEVVDRR